MKILDIITEDPTPVSGITSEATLAEIKAWIAKNPGEAKRIAELEQYKWTSPMRGFVKLLGIAEPAYMFVKNWLALNRMAAFKNPDGQFTYTKEWIKSAENALIGQFIASQAIRGALRLTLKAPVIKELLVFFFSLVRIPPAVSKVIVEAGLSGVSIWFASDEGLTWLTTGVIVPYLTNGVGAITGGITKWLYDKVWTIPGLAQFKPADSNIAQRAQVTPMSDAEKEASRKAGQSVQANYDKDLRDRYLKANPQILNPDSTNPYLPGYRRPGQSQDQLK